MARYLIDTDILSFYLKNNPAVTAKMHQHLDTGTSPYISIITYYEALSGLYANDATNKLSAFHTLMQHCPILPVSKKSATISARIYRDLRHQGKMLANMDLLIAGIAIDNDITLVSHNTKHFARIPDLALVDWMIP